MRARIYKEADGTRLAAVQSPSGKCFVGRKRQDGPFRQVTKTQAPSLCKTSYIWEEVQRHLDEYANQRGLQEERL